MRFASAFDGCETVVAVVRQEDARFVDVNSAMFDQLGWQPDEVIGKRTVDIDLWPDADTRARIWSALRMRQRVISMPLLARHRDGREIPSLLDVECFDRDGEALTFCLLRVGNQRTTLAADPDIEQHSYRELYLSATEGLYRSLPDGDFIDVNPAMARIFGFDSPASMLGRRNFDAAGYYVDSDHARDVRLRMRGEHGLRGVRSRIRRRDGVVRWILENAHSVLDEHGNIRFFEGSVVDITEQMASEDALRQSEAMYRVVVDNCRDGVFLIQHGLIVFANQSLASIVGRPLASLIGSEYMKLVASEDRDAQSRRREARESGSMEVQNFEVHIVRPDGESRLLSIRADAVTVNGEAASTGLIRDITDERAQLRALEVAERRYRELFERSPVGLFRTRTDGSLVDVNPAMANMLGYESAADLREQFGNIVDFYSDPAERPLLVERLLRDGHIVDHETQVICRDGRDRWVTINVNLLTDSSDPDEGSASGSLFSGSVQDIHHRRMIEEALLRSEARYRLLVEHSQSGVFVALNRHFVYVNQSMTAMLGYAEQELMALDLAELVAPDYRAAALERMERFERGESLPPEFESCYQHRDGQRVFVTVSAGPIELDGRRHLTGTVRDITRHREAEQRLRFHASHDALTGLPNRMVFHQRLNDRISRAHAENTFDYVVLFVDLDGFKLVNDGLGHAAGDRLLIRLAAELETHFRDEALVARYGGDEFTLMSLNPCDEPCAVQMASRLLTLFSKPMEVGGHRMYTGASIGIVLGRREYSRPDQILRDADTAMYRAKALGKAAYVVFDESMHQAAQQRLSLETDLRQALEREEFRIHFQPIVELENGRLRGCEALLRWQHPRRGLLLPRDFLAVAEEAGLLASIDWWVMRRAAQLMAGWHRRFPEYEHLTLSVNMDERQFSESQLTGQVIQTLADAGLSPDRVQLEITETVFRNGRQHASQRLQELKALGVSLVVDDFGTGYSSLESFAAAPFDALKIDHSFVADLTSNPRHHAIVRTIVRFAEDLGLSLIAEGVETREQQRLLLAMGCRFAQGYLFSRPVDHLQFESLLAGETSLQASIG